MVCQQTFFERREKDLKCLKLFDRISGFQNRCSPKLGALWRVISRMTLVPKHDHISRNCWATFFSDPGLFPATQRENISMRKRWRRGGALELTPASILGLNPQERKTCQQVNYLICPQGHAFLLNFCLDGGGRYQGNQILQAHIWHIMGANGKLEDIINWEDWELSGSE